MLLNPLNNLPSVAALGNLVGQQRKDYCCIRNGVLYQYDRKTAREAKDRFKLGNVSALDLKSEEKEHQIRMIYKKFYVILTFDDLTEA